MGAEASLAGPLPGAVRDYFPICKNKTYVNACSQGALSVQVREAYDSYLRDWDERGAPWEYWVELAERARAAFADLINATPDEVAVTTSLSAGVGAPLRTPHVGERETIVATDL
ncbi:MAG: hypothetical protein ACR2OD_13265 [Gaiellaceae bacterium]